MNEAPLTADHGYPLRTVVPGFIGARSVKWLAKIVVSDRTSPNHYVAEAYKVAGLDGRTTGSLRYQTSQKLRKRVEEIFGWAKEIGGLRRTRKRGTPRVGLSGLLILCAYNLVRMGKLAGNSS